MDTCWTNLALCWQTVMYVVWIVTKWRWRSNGPWKWWLRWIGVSSRYSCMTCLERLSNGVRHELVWLQCQILQDQASHRFSHPFHCMIVKSHSLQVQKKHIKRVVFGNKGLHIDFIKFQIRKWGAYEIPNLSAKGKITYNSTIEG